MTTSSRESHAFRFDETKGVDKRSSDLRKSPGYLRKMVNCIYDINNDDIKSRSGYKAVATSCGGHGLATYNWFNSESGAVESILLAVSSTIERLNEYTLTIGYSGSNNCTASVYLDTTTATYKFKIVEASTTKLDQDLGVGFDETSPYTMTQLATAISAITGGLFTGTVSALGSTPAAMLPLTDVLSFNGVTDGVFTFLSPAEVNRSRPTMLQWFEDHKDDDFFSNCVPIQYRNSIFFPNPGTYGLLKYDSQKLYKAGVPTPTNPTVAETNASAGVAEATTIVCRGAAAIAEVSTLTTIADSGTAEVTRIISSGSGGSSFNNNYVGLYGINAGTTELHVYWFDFESTGSQPSVPGATSYTRIPVVSADSVNATMTNLSNNVNASPRFATSMTGNDVIVTNSTSGSVPDAFVSGSALSGASVTTQGVSGLHQTYFSIYDENGMAVFWYNIGGSGVQPTVSGANRYVAITTVTGGMTANQVATQTKLAVDADSKFSATVLTNVVTITDTSTVIDDRIDISAGTTGFTAAVTTQGQATLQSKYFRLPSPDGLVAFWFNIAGGGVEPSHGAPRAVVITTVGAADNASAVATATEAVIEADIYSSTVSTATIVATNDDSGPLDPHGDSGNSGFTVTTTVVGVGTGLGDGVFKYKLTVIFTDKNGVTIEGNASDPVTIDFSAATKDGLLTIQGVQPETGYNTGCAIVNGAQAAVTIINVDSGHTIVAGDPAYLYDSTASVLAFVTKTVQSVTSTTIVLDAAVSVTDNIIISTGLKIGIYRTKEDQEDFFLVAETPNNSINGTFTYQDSKPDSQLTAQFISPVTDRSPPGSFKAIAIYQDVGIAVGFDDDQDKAKFSDIDSLEYFPADTGEFLVTTGNGDSTSAVLSNNEAAVIGKIEPDDRLGSVNAVFGTLDENANFSVETKARSLGIVCQSSIFDFEPGTSGYVTSRGCYFQMGGNTPQSISDRIFSVFRDRDFNSSKLYLRRTVSINDAENERVLVFLEVAPKTGTKYANSFSRVWVYDYSLQSDGSRSNRWYEWSNVNAAAGFARIGADIYFSERRLSTFSGQVEHILYKFNRLDSSSDYADHVDAIPSEIETFWEYEEQPAVLKDFKLLKLYSYDTSSFSILCRISYDFQDGNYITSKTVSFGGSQDDDSVVQLVDGKTKAIKINLTHSTLKENFSLAGWEMMTDKTYRGIIS